ncbi:response regulator [Azospirillum sp. SYSU D00513]|uniref:response regulator n=1 Tax=Azospirillum sp. SYSU D00513 TaxID=2812561 RepID=UPI001A97AF39|nr:response regulator [Azospirillum sp. SYSU D00513]
MRAYDFSQVEAAVLDSQHSTLRMFREVLTRLGVGKVETYSSIREAGPLLAGATPDLIIVSSDGDDLAEAFKLVRALRNDPATQNPFAGIVVTTWQPTQALLLRVSNSGADDLLMKPVSPKQVQDRITALIEARKSFVVTADYIGPDRRKSPREGTQVPLIDAPNTLRLKAVRGATPAQLRPFLAKAGLQVNTQKLVRLAIQIAFLVDFATPGLAASPPERMAVEHLARVPGFAEEMARRLHMAHAKPGAENGEAEAMPVHKSCAELRAIAEEIRGLAEAGPVPAAKLETAWELAGDLMQGADPGRPRAAMEQEVRSAVAGYRARLEQMVQAKAAERAAASAPASVPADSNPAGEEAASAA